MTPKDKKLSQFDPGEVLKSAHELQPHALRVFDIRSVVEEYFTRADVVYNGEGSAISADFYLDKEQQRTSVTTVADIANSLNNTYFQLWSAVDKTKYHVWYNVSGGGVDPAPLDSTPIEVAIMTGDSANVVALATKLTIALYDDFLIDSRSLPANTFQIYNYNPGLSTDTVDFDTGFAISTVLLGTSEIVKKITLPFTGGRKYIYNEAEKRFEIVDTTVAASSIGVSPNIVNSLATLANTEYSISLPDGTKKFTMKSRDYNTDIQFSYTATESGTTFITIPRCNEYENNNLLLDGTINIYYQVTKPNVTIEVEYWT